jgi:hypothetical protein
VSSRRRWARQCTTVSAGAIKWPPTKLQQTGHYTHSFFQPQRVDHDIRLVPTQARSGVTVRRGSVEVQINPGRRDS